MNSKDLTQKDFDQFLSSLEKEIGAIKHKDEESLQSLWQIMNTRYEVHGSLT